MDTLRQQRILPGVAIVVVLTVLAYVPALGAGYVWDDDHHVFPDLMQDGLDGLWRIWSEPGATIQYYPLVFTVFWIENQLWGIDHPFGFHLVNVLLHAAAAVFFWRVLERLGFAAAGGRPWPSPAWVAGLIFAVHPVAVESVAWITEHKNTLSAAFYMAALLAYLRFRGVGPATDRQGDGAAASRGGYVLAILLFLCAVLSKTATLTLPAALLVVLWWRRRPLGREVLPVLPMFGIAVALGLVTLWVERNELRTFGSDWDLSLVQRFLMAGRVPWFYATKIVAPFELTFIYPRWQIDPSSIVAYLFPAATLGVVVSLWLLRRRTGRGPLAAVLLFLGTLAPILGFLDAYSFRFSWVADHYQYLAVPWLVAFVVLLAKRGLRALHAPRALAIALSAVVVLVLGALTWRQSRIYEDYETLWRDTLDKNPSAWIAHNNLGLFVGARGDTAQAAERFAEAARLKPDDPVVRMNLARSLSMLGRLEAAEAEFARAVALGPQFPLIRVNYAEHLLRAGRPEAAAEQLREVVRQEPTADAHSRLGAVLARLGRTAEAVQSFRAALQLDPADARPHLGLAVLLEAEDDAAQAIPHYARAVELDPGMIGAHQNLARLLARQGRLEEAAASYARAVELRPAIADLRLEYGRVLARLGRTGEAADQLRTVLESAPQHPGVHHLLSTMLLGSRFEEGLAHLRRAVQLEPDHAAALTDLAWVLATHPDPATRNGAAALELARRAVELTGGRVPETLDALAAAQAETGRFDEAVRSATRALEGLEAAGRAERAREVAARIGLYRSRRPFRSAAAGREAMPGVD